MIDHQELPKELSQRQSGCISWEDFLYLRDPVLWSVKLVKGTMQTDIVTKDLLIWVLCKFSQLEETNCSFPNHVLACHFSYTYQLLLCWFSSQIHSLLLSHCLKPKTNTVASNAVYTICSPTARLPQSRWVFTHVRVHFPQGVGSICQEYH